jgi:hypothetical protein
VRLLDRLAGANFCILAARGTDFPLWHASCISLSSAIENATTLWAEPKT